MKIKEMLAEVAALVAEREIIDHGSIRCLYSAQACREIESAEGCDEVETGTIGDDELAEKISEILENPERLLDADDLLDVLRDLDRAHRGGEISDYLENDEDELSRLDDLIEAAEKFVEAV